MKATRPRHTSLNIDLRLLAKNKFCLFDLLLYAQVNSYGHVGMLSVERDVKQYSKQTKILFAIKGTSRDFGLSV